MDFWGDLLLQEFRLVVDHSVYDLDVVKHNLVCVAMNIEMAWDFSK